MPDIFYLSYQDDFSEKNYERIWELTDTWDADVRIEIVSDIQGIYAAHSECAKRSQTENFFVVDADAWLVDSFDISYDPVTQPDVYPGKPAKICTHVWRAQNAATGKIYGYGGVKLFNVGAFVGDDDVVDMTTTVAKRGYPYYAVQSVSNISKFNTTPLKAWRGAFRECAKLSSGTMDGESERNLEYWMHPLEDAEHRDYIIKGAETGMQFGKRNAGKKDQLKKVNDWNWLEAFFKQVIEV